MFIEFELSSILNNELKIPEVNSIIVFIVVELTDMHLTPTIEWPIGQGAKLLDWRCKRCLQMNFDRFSFCALFAHFFDFSRQRETEQLFQRPPWYTRRGGPDIFYARELFARSDWILTQIGSSVIVFWADQNELKIIEFGPADQNWSIWGISLILR